MSNLRIKIHGRFYDITCEKNKEKYVLELAKQFDEKVNNLSFTFAQIIDSLPADSTANVLPIFSAISRAHGSIVSAHPSTSTWTSSSPTKCFMGSPHGLKKVSILVWSIRWTHSWKDYPGGIHPWYSSVSLAWLAVVGWLSQRLLDSCSSAPPTYGS